MMGKDCPLVIVVVARVDESMRLELFLRFHVCNGLTSVFALCLISSGWSVVSQITYWDAVDGSAIRIMDGSTSHEVTSLSIAHDGSAFVSGGGDKIVKV
jgi:WD40 repeat protein